MTVALPLFFEKCKSMGETARQHAVAPEAEQFSKRQTTNHRARLASTLTKLGKKAQTEHKVLKANSISWPAKVAPRS
jgi:hypothetical protein